MAENKPEPKPAAGVAGIPVGKLVSDRSEKPTAPRPKPKPPVLAEAPVAVPIVGPAVPETLPTAPTRPTGSDFDVELVAVPCAPPKPVKPRDQRRLFELDRRDFIMMGAGVSATLIAVVVGLVASKALQSKPAEDKSGDSDPKSKTGAHGSDAK
jgi:hypothetical protein